MMVITIDQRWWCWDVKLREWFGNSKQRLPVVSGVSYLVNYVRTSRDTYGTTMQESFLKYFKFNSF